MHTFSVQLPLLGVCNIYFDKEDITKFSYRQLGNYVINNPIKDSLYSKKGNAVLKFQSETIVQKFRAYSNFSPVLKKGACWKNNNIDLGEYSFSLTSDSLLITVHEAEGKINTLKNIYRMLISNTEEKKYALLGGQFYHNVLFPMLAVYAAVHGLFCVHGSLIHTFSKQNIILSGLDGVGKSTLADMICSEAGNMLLADNIVLFNGKQALNFNLAMRLEAAAKTGNKVIYSNNKIKEILPPALNYNLCKVNKIFNILLDNTGSTVTKMEIASTPHDWIMFMENAPEIGQANHILAYWLFNHGLLERHENITVPIVSIAIPKGMLIQGKELIENELKIFS